MKRCIIGSTSTRRAGPTLTLTLVDPPPTRTNNVILDQSPDRTSSFRTLTR